VRSSKPALCFCVSEASLAAFLYACLTGRRVFVIGAFPLLGRSTALLDRIIAWATRRGLAKPLAAFSPDMPWVDSLPGDGYYNDILERVEARLHARFDWSSAPPAIAPMAYMMKKAVTDYLQAVQIILLFVNWADAHAKPGTWRLKGAPPFYALIKALYDGDGSNPPAVASLTSLTFWNVANSLLTVLGAIFWLLLRVRLRVETERYRLALDILSNDESENLLPKLGLAPNEILIVFRTPLFQQRLAKTYAPYRQCLLGDARILPKTFFRLVAQIFRDQLALYSAFAVSADAGLFVRLCVLSYKSALFAAFYENFRPKFHWGRDDYSLDHGIRNVELRKIGGISLGINHGLPLNTYAAQWREIDFDVYFVFGRHLYERYYKDAWPSRMRVVAIGNLRASSLRRGMDLTRKTGDIAYFPIENSQLEAAFRHVWDVARAFPERKIYVKPKGGRGRDFNSTLQKMSGEAPSNVLVLPASASPYALLESVSYVITTGSTLAVESLQFQAASFVLDVDPKLGHFLYRDFPQMWVKTGADITMRIQELESGRATYDYKALEPLIALSVDDPAALIRAELGRPT
jgi:hypothetical protein